MKTPTLHSSSDSLLYKQLKKERQQARKTNDDTPAKRGTKKGHIDTSHKRKSTARYCSKCIIVTFARQFSIFGNVKLTCVVLNV